MGIHTVEDLVVNQALVHCLLRYAKFFN